MNILDQVIETVAETLNIDSSAVTADSSDDNIDAWDSLAQVNLMIALEQTFDLDLDVEDFMNLNSVSAITAFVEDNVSS